MTEKSNAGPIIIKSWLDGRVLFSSAKAKTTAEALAEAVASRADLSGADLSGAFFAFAQIAFLGHGECGRMLTAIRRKKGDAPELFCGCFTGNTKALREYIAAGPEMWRKTRTLALDTVLMLLDARNGE